MRETDSVSANHPPEDAHPIILSNFLTPHAGERTQAYKLKPCLFWHHMYFRSGLDFYELSTSCIGPTLPSDTITTKWAVISPKQYS